MIMYTSLHHNISESAGNLSFTELMNFKTISGTCTMDYLRTTAIGGELSNIITKLKDTCEQWFQVHKGQS